MSIEALHFRRMETLERNQARAFARAVKLRAANPTALHVAEVLAEQKYGAGSAELALIQKGTVAPAATTSAGWAGNIAAVSQNAFVGAAGEIGIFGKVTTVPVNTNAVGLASGASAAFVAEGAPAPLSSMVLASNALPPKQVVATLVISQELARMSDPRAEVIFERELRKAVVNAIDGALLSTNAASATTPAGLFDGLTPITATSAATADVRDLVDDFSGDLTTAFFIGDPKTMASLADPARPLVGIHNGELLNAPAYVSRNCPAGILALIDGDGVFCATDDIDVSISTEASAIMANNPSAPGANLSFWQLGLVGIRLSLTIDWKTIRPGSVSLISGAAW